MAQLQVRCAGFGPLGAEAQRERLIFAPLQPQGAQEGSVATCNPLVAAFSASPHARRGSAEYSQDPFRTRLNGRVEAERLRQRHDVPSSRIDSPLLDVGGWRRPPVAIAHLNFDARELLV